MGWKLNEFEGDAVILCYKPNWINWVSVTIRVQKLAKNCDTGPLIIPHLATVTL